MVFDVKTLALVNLGIQIFLIVFVFCAVYFVKKGKPLKHCTMVRIAIPLQILAIITVMLPSLLGYIKIEPIGIFNAELLIHHTLGLLVIVLWIYVNLAFSNIIRMPGNFRMFMRTALGLWLLSLVLGLHIYTRLYV
jgi:uncharacterized membrane protein YozB (DUF420 family)